MVIDFTPSIKESEEARILKLKEDAEEAGIKAEEILNSIGIKYIIRLYNEGGCIKSVSYTHLTLPTNSLV